MIVTRTVLETANGTFSVAMHEDSDRVRCLSSSLGDVSQAGTFVRLHSSCMFGEALRACDCDCGQQLSTAMQEIDRHGSGVLVYLFQEGRGAGLARKIEGMEIQRTLGVNSYEAYARLGMPRDLRDYGVAGVALDDLGVSKTITLLSNNPTKRAALEELGYLVGAQVALSYRVSQSAYEYLLMKQTEGNHALDFSKISFVG